MKGAKNMAVFRVEKNKGYTVMSNHHLRKQGTDLKGKGLAFSNAFTSGKLGLCPFSIFYHRKINAQFSSIFFIRSCSFLATCILRLLANIIISLLTRRQRGTIASIIPKKLNPNKINER